MKEFILDVARWVKSLFNTFSQATLFGMPLDWVFHLLGAILITWVASAYLARKRVIILGVSLLITKELFDIFAKTRLEYIRPPEADIALDLASGLVGLAIGLWLAKRRPLVERGPV